VTTGDPSDVELVLCPGCESETCPPSSVSICVVSLFFALGGHIVFEYWLKLLFHLLLICTQD